MRIALLIATVALAGLLILLLRTGDDRTHERDAVEESMARREAGDAAEERAPGEGGPVRSAPEHVAPEHAPVVHAKGLLVYEDGAPAAGIRLYLAVGRPFHTKQFRNRDYPEKVIWLITNHPWVATGDDGSFEFPVVRGPTGSRALLHTDLDSAAHVLKVLEPGETRIVATRRVHVTGTLIDEEGRPIRADWIRAQRELPEDWDTRRSKEPDSFVHPTDGEIDVGTELRIETPLEDDGSFEIRLVPGRNYVLCPTLDVEPVLLDVPRSDKDLGQVKVRARRTLNPFERSGLHGLVLDMAGNPHADARVEVWDETVGDTARDCYSDESGRFRVDGLGGSRTIAWAVYDTQRRHAILPEQSSGTIRLPCNTPVILRLPTPAEYLWLEPRLTGYLLIERGGIFLGSGPVDPSEAIGLPPGSYHLIVVTAEGRILEGDRTVRKGGRAPLSPAHLHDTTWAVD